jgi:C4-dicarboxylate-specific signal transduction histidine kinase
LNLVTDAIEAISSERSSATIQITSAVIRDHVLISVIEDSPWKKTGSSRLSASRAIVREIGGDLWVSTGASGRMSTIDLPSASLN